MIHEPWHKLFVIGPLFNHIRRNAQTLFFSEGVPCVLLRYGCEYLLRTHLSENQQGPLVAAFAADGEGHLHLNQGTQLQLSQAFGFGCDSESGGIAKYQADLGRGAQQIDWETFGEDLRMQ